MDSTPDTKQTDPHNVSPGLSTQEIELVARADERLAHAYEQIARADEQLARVNEQISKLEQDAPRKKSANGYRRPSRGRPASTRLCRPAVDSGHLYRCFRVPVLWRNGQADAGCGFAVAGGNSEARRPAQPTCRSVGYGGCFANTTFGSARAARRGSRPDSSRADTVAPNDGA